MSTDHIVFRWLSNEGHCRHCGDRYKFKLPMSTENMGSRIEAFVLLHADCPCPEQPKIDIPTHNINRS
jgi:hypothetical protein